MSERSQDSVAAYVAEFAHEIQPLRVPDDRTFFLRGFFFSLLLLEEKASQPQALPLVGLRNTRKEEEKKREGKKCGRNIMQGMRKIPVITVPRFLPIM